MNYNTAKKINDTFQVTREFKILYGASEIIDGMQKGYIYANLYFYDEVQKEVEKLRAMVEKLYTEVTTELGMDDSEPQKLILEISTRATRMIGDDSMDYLIKDFLSAKSKHVALMPDENERKKFDQIHNAIFTELLGSFYQMTIAAAVDYEGQRMFKFSRAYVANMTDRQKSLVAPALRIIALENKLRLQNLRISEDWTVKYIPETVDTAFGAQEDAIKDNIKAFIQSIDSAPKF